MPKQKQAPVERVEKTKLHYLVRSLNETYVPRVVVLETHGGGQVFTHPIPDLNQHRRGPSSVACRRHQEADPDADALALDQWD